MSINLHCPNCTLDTGGNHEFGCPMNPIHKHPGVYGAEQVFGKLSIFRMGWKCPRCRTIWNPEIKKCDCEEL